jgi:hypothetical protein
MSNLDKLKGLNLSQPESESQANKTGPNQKDTPDKVRTHVVAVRFTKREVEALKKYAEINGFTMSSYLRVQGLADLLKRGLL